MFCLEVFAWALGIAAMAHYLYKMVQAVKLYGW